MRRLVLITTIALVIAGGLAIAQAAIPSTDGTIHGCRKLNNPAKGSVIVVDDEAGDSCPSGFAELDWNQTGPAGPGGPQGQPGVSGYEVVTVTQDVTLSEPEGRGTLSAGCPHPKKVMGGGATVNRPGLGIAASQPDVLGTGWEVLYERFSGTENPVQITVRAICAVVS